MPFGKEVDEHFVLNIKNMENNTHTSDCDSNISKESINQNENHHTDANNNIIKDEFDINKEQDQNISAGENNTDTNTENNDWMKKIEQLNQQLAEINDKYIRLLAEFDNFRKRSRKEKEDLIKYSGEDAWKNILPIIDDFERALKENQNTDEIEVVKKGFDLIYNKFKHILSQKNVQMIEVLHQPFNPDIMEAVAKIPASSEEMKGKVVEVLENAYQINDKIIRHAKVIVAE